MATWSSDNVILTEIGQQILSKVQAGVGAITVTRIVTGGTIIPYAQLYKATSIPDIKQECTIISVNTDMKGSEISVSVSNEALEESYSLYTLGIYVTHPDFEGEQLYLVAECDISNPDVVPLPSVTVATLYYSLYMVHNNTDQIIINVDTSGSLPLTGGTITGNLTVDGKLQTTQDPTEVNDVVTLGYFNKNCVTKHVQVSKILSSSAWSDNTQQVAIEEVATTDTVIVGPDPASAEAYTDAGILCISQAEGSLTFKCDTVPSGDVTVNIVLIGGVVGDGA